MEKIVWDDAGGFGLEGKTWHTSEEILEAFNNSSFLNTSVGHVVYETPHALVIAQSKAPNKEGFHDEYAGLLYIPKSLVCKREPVQPIDVQIPGKDDTL